MKIMDLNKEAILKQAHITFAQKVVELDQMDVYLDDIETGEIQIDGIDHPLFVNTHYVYENHLVNNNQTRYKISLTLLSIKEHAYEVIFDSKEKYYVAYEDDQIHFVLYEDFQAFIRPYVHIKEVV